MSKICIKCKIDKTLDEFSRQAGRKDGRRSVCKKCHNDYVRNVWYKKNAEKQAEASAKWKAANKNKVLATKYKCSVAVIDGLLAIGKCQICVSVKDLHIDHCHDTGEVRGILCRGCNQGLGNFTDDVDKLASAIVYLKSSRDRAVRSARLAHNQEVG